ncbi:unnamed protein product [Colias eurytheme]|nr:unnamed protein product [Colias eurytheme]
MLKLNKFPHTRTIRTGGRIELYLTWKSLHIFMGIHHSSDTKTSQEHDNNCQICHSTASLTRTIGAEAGRRLTRARRVSAAAGTCDVSELRSARIGPASPDLLRLYGFRHTILDSTFTALRPPALYFHEKQN